MKFLVFCLKFLLIFISLDVLLSTAPKVVMMPAMAGMVYSAPNLFVVCVFRLMFWSTAILPIGLKLALKKDVSKLKAVCLTALLYPFGVFISIFLLAGVGGTNVSPMMTFSALYPLYCYLVLRRRRTLSEQALPSAGNA